MNLRRRSHGEGSRYVVYVLWTIGFSQRAIAKAVGLRTKQVAGIIDNSDYRDRASLTDGQRATQLAELESIRSGEDGTTLDGGVLDGIQFRIRPLGTRQHRGPLRRKIRRGA